MVGGEGEHLCTEDASIEKQSAFQNWQLAAG